MPRDGFAEGSEFRDDFVRDSFAEGSSLSRGDGEVSPVLRGMFDLPKIKPLGAKINWKAPLNRGLLRWYAAGYVDNQRETIQELVAQHNATWIEAGGSPEDFQSDIPVPGQLAADIDASLTGAAGLAVPDAAATGHTIAFWANYTSNSGTGWNVAVSQELWNSSQGWFIGIRGVSGEMEYTIPQGDDNTVYAVGLVNANGWHFNVVTHSAAGVVQCYFDGWADSTETYSFPTHANVPFNIGARHANDGTGSNDRMRGRVGDVRYYNRVLSASEVRNLYNASLGGYQEELIRPSTMPIEEKTQVLGIGTEFKKVNLPAKGSNLLKADMRHPLNKGLLTWVLSSSANRQYDDQGGSSQTKIHDAGPSRFVYKGAIDGPLQADEWRPGALGPAWDFNRVDSHIQTLDNVRLLGPNTANAFTFSFWFWNQDNNTSSDMFASDPGFNHYVRKISGAIQLENSNVALSQFISTRISAALIPDDQWAHIVIGHNGTTGQHKGWVNGVPVAVTTPDVDNPTVPVHDLRDQYIIGDPGGFSDPGGRMDDIRYQVGLLTDQQVAELYRESSTGHQNTLRSTPLFIPVPAAVAEENTDVGFCHTDISIKGRLEADMKAPLNSGLLCWHIRGGLNNNRAHWWDASPNDQHLVDGGGSPTFTVRYGRPGALAPAAEFRNSSSDYMHYPVARRLAASNSRAVTISAWILNDASTGADEIYGFSRNGSADGISLIRPSGTTDLEVGLGGSGTSATATITSALTVGAWVHVVVACDSQAGSAQAWVNGTQASVTWSGSSGFSISLNSTSGRLRMSRFAGGPGIEFDGALDDCRIQLGLIPGDKIYKASVGGWKNEIKRFSQCLVFDPNPPVCQTDLTLKPNKTKFEAAVDPLNQGLVRWWGGKVRNPTSFLDLSPARTPGTITGGTIIPGPAPGIHGINLADDTDVVTSATTASGQGITTLTIALWMKAAESGTKTIVENSTRFLLAGSSTSNRNVRFRVDMSGGDVEALSDNFIYNLSEWVHLTVTWNGDLSGATGIKFYRNGIDWGNNSPLTGVTDDKTEAGWSLSSTVAGGMNGAFADFRVYNRVLSPNEVTALYTASANGYPTQIKRTGVCVLGDAADDPTADDVSLVTDDRLRTLLRL